MRTFFSYDRFLFFLNRMRERLWIKPFAACMLSLLSIYIASAVDRSSYAHALPEVSASSVENLLSILTGGMLMIATFAVGAMVSAYGSASNTATPRSFSAVVADDTSQFALSVFIATFIFSVVGLAALKNNYLESPGRTILFGLTICVYILVIYTFVRWVDHIARLGRLGTTIENVEKATSKACRRRSQHPNLNARALKPGADEGETLSSTSVGYLQRVDIQSLQNIAEEHDLEVFVLRLPGSFVSPDQGLVKFKRKHPSVKEFDPDGLRNAFQIGKDRLFDEDPRFGLIVLAEIASKALSPAVNDPGTAIDVLGSLHRILDDWGRQKLHPPQDNPAFDRVYVPEISTHSLFEDAFRSLARDGAHCVEVVHRLQKTLGSLSEIEAVSVKEAAGTLAKESIERAELAMKYPPDFQHVLQVYQEKFKE